MQALPPVRSWHDFPAWVKSIRDEYGHDEWTNDSGQKHSRKNQILFRGQSSCEWKLATTLERAPNTQPSLFRYLRTIDTISSHLESTTGRQWHLPDIDNLLTNLSQNKDPLDIALPTATYSFMAYLRQHGFPSPLLDWSQSPYIAAYFAIESAPEGADFCSVYAYIESFENMTRIEGKPMITVLGPHVTTHGRHFMQKSIYTMSTIWDSRKAEHLFCSHEYAFDDEEETQGILFKVNIPLTGRAEALQQLDEFNINHYTLFQTEDALVKSLGMKRFDMAIDG